MPLVLARSTLVCLVRANPLPLAGLALLSGWPLLTLPFATAIRSRSRSSSSDIYEFAFLSLVLGTVAGVTVLGRLGPVFERTSARRRWAQGYALLCLSACSASALTVFTQTWFTGTGVAGLPSGVATAIGLSALHLSAIGSAIIASPTPASVRSMALVAVAWLIPAMVPDTFAETAVLRASRTLPLDWAASLIEFEPILAWLAAALLLEVGRTRRA